MKRFLIPFFLVVLSGLSFISCDTKIYESDTPYLEQVTIFSRHGARVPLAEYEADLALVVGEGLEWPIWPVEGGHLSFRGATLEYVAGQNFRKEFLSEGLCLTPENVYFCASPKQRTVQTSEAFATGLLDGEAFEVHYKGAKDFSDGFLDPEFLPLFDYTTAPDFNWDAFRTEALREMNEMAARVDWDASYSFMENALDYKNSIHAKTNGKEHFDKSVSFTVEKLTASGKPAEPDVAKGCDLLLANRASDAFVLQYYEQDDYALKKYKLTENLSYSDFQRLAAIKDVEVDLVFTAPIVAVNVSHNMLLMLKREMETPGRKLTFMCAHDSSVSSLLAALRVQPYQLDASTAIERKTPIGVKIVIEKWAVGKEHYAKVYLAYYSTTQMRKGNPAELLGDAGRLQRQPIGFEGLTLAPNGMYRYDDLMAHIDATLALYDKTARGEKPF